MNQRSVLSDAQDDRADASDAKAPAFSNAGNSDGSGNAGSAIARGLHFKSASGTAIHRRRRPRQPARELCRHAIIGSVYRCSGRSLPGVELGSPDLGEPGSSPSVRVVSRQQEFEAHDRRRTRSASGADGKFRAIRSGGRIVGWAGSEPFQSRGVAQIFGTNSYPCARNGQSMIRAPFASTQVQRCILYL